MCTAKDISRRVAVLSARRARCRRVHIKRLLGWSAPSVLFALVFTGCNGEPKSSCWAQGTIWQVASVIKECPKTGIGPSDPEILAPADYLNHECVTEVSPCKPLDAKCTHAYADKNWVLHDVPPVLMGSTLVQTKYGDRFDQGAGEFLKVKLKYKIVTHYVAFDDNKGVPFPPGFWLEKDYQPLRGPGGSDVFVTVTRLPDPPISSEKTYRLKLWEPKRENWEPIPGFPDEPGDEVKLPRNFAGYQGPVPVDPAMYLLFLKPITIADCSPAAVANVVGQYPRYFDVCAYSEEEAQNVADWATEEIYADLVREKHWVVWPHYTEDWKRTHVVDSKIGVCPGRQPCCWDESYKTNGQCASATPVGAVIGKSANALWCRLWQEGRGYPISSEIEFDPKVSNVVVQVAGGTYTSGVKGRLDFEYVYSGSCECVTSMRVNSMFIELEKAIEGYHDIKLALLDSADAQCSPGTEHPFTKWPCDSYEVPEGTLYCGLNGTHEGSLLLYTAGNGPGTTLIGVDHFNRQFVYSGNLRTDVDGRPMNITLNLKGEFVNFAPHAEAGLESDQHCPCGLVLTAPPPDAEYPGWQPVLLSGNMNPVHLDAAGSFEVYGDFIPQHAYEWYEDYGLVTEKPWGQGDQVNIPPYELGYGIHRFTLVLRDYHGIVDTDTVEVDIYDDTPPTLVPPDDVFLFLPATEPSPLPGGGAAIPGKIKVDIGTATAKDNCSADVQVTNDAPADLLFPTGAVTTVTWLADDGRGNSATAEQKVFIWVPQEVWPGPFTEMVTHVRAKIMACREQAVSTGLSSAWLDSLANTSRSVAGLVEVAGTLPVVEHREAERAAIVGLLSKTKAGLDHTRDTARVLLEAPASVRTMQLHSVVAELDLVHRLIAGAEAKLHSLEPLHDDGSEDGMASP